MTEPPRSFLSQQMADAVSSSREAWRVLRQKGPSKVTFWFIALAIGIAAGFAALFFRKGINLLQETLYGTDDVQYLHSFISGLEWYWVVLIPTFGGLVTGLILHNFTRDARARSVADVIVGSALHEGRVETRAGLASALASMVTLGTGGSSGREGPVVHLAAVISTWVNRRINADGITGRQFQRAYRRGALCAGSGVAALCRPCLCPHRDRQCRRYGDQPDRVWRCDRIQTPYGR